VKRVLGLAMLVVGGLVAFELPSLRRYLKIEKM
jgi:hypothetical protein